MNGVHGARLGRMFGIDLRFDASWLVVLVLVVWSFAAVFGQDHIDWSRPAVLGTALAGSVLLFISISVHELAHALVARHFGESVQTVALFLFGGVSNIEREPRSPKVEFFTAVVGPAASLILGIACTAVAHATLAFPTPRWLADETAGTLWRYAPTGRAAFHAFGPWATLLVWLGPINVAVGLFNLIPAFPLDGGRILRSGIWAATGDLAVATRWASGVGQAVGWVFVVVGVALAFGAAVPWIGRGAVAGLWLAFVGWFLVSAAAEGSKRRLARETLDRLPVRHLMSPVGTAVPASMSVGSLIHPWVAESGRRAFPVVDEDNRLMGVVSLADIGRTPRAAWTTTDVAKIMTPVSGLVTASPDEPLTRALDKITQSDVGQLPVLDGTRRLVGMLSRRDLMRWLELFLQSGDEHPVASGNERAVNASGVAPQRSLPREPHPHAR